MQDEPHSTGEQPVPGARLPGEPDKAHHAWTIYRDLGQRRSLDAVAQQLLGQAGDKPGTQHVSGRRARTRQIQDWSRQWRWVERAKTWDDHCDREARLAQVEAIKDMNRRHAQEARALQSKALEALRQLTANDLIPADVLRYLTEAAKLERLALGEATATLKQEVKHSGPLVLEVVERIIPVRGGGGPVTARRVELPAATGGADAPPFELIADSRSIEIVDDGTGESPDFQLPDEPPQAPPRR
jgi:hypothetical protein